MIQNKRISLIVPCRNEAGIIGGFIQRVPSYIDEILVIDNNSTDESFKEAKHAGAIVIKEKRTKNGIGYGFAHQTGIANATGDIIIAMDGDDTYPLNSIKSIVTTMIRREWDIVSCARLPLDNPKAISWIRRMGIAILNWEVRLLYGYPMRDILTGMWLGRKDALHHLHLSQGDWNFSPEIKLAALHDKHISFAEHHIGHFVRKNSISKQHIWKTGFEHLWYVAKRRFTIDTPLSWIADKDWAIEINTYENS